MGLLSAIRHAQPTFSLDQAAKMLADSDCELNDADLITDMLIGLGIQPWLLIPHDDGRHVDVLEIWIAAHNLRTLRTVSRRKYPIPRQDF